jgi:polyisoprenoid-binding protein YceI
MKKLPFLFALALLLGSAALYIGTAKWTAAKENYSVKFKGGKLDGFFTGLESEVSIDEKDMTRSYVNASIDAGSIKTGNGLRDEHATSEEALNAVKYPRITFKSSAVEKRGENYIATGTLTLKGVSKTIAIPFSFVEDGDAASLKGSFTVMPKDYGVTRGGTPDEVAITLDLPYGKS